MEFKKMEFNYKSPAGDGCVRQTSARPRAPVETTPIGSTLFGLLLGNLCKIGSNFLGVCPVIFDDNIRNGDFQEVGNIPPIEKALVKKKYFYEN